MGSVRGCISRISCPKNATGPSGTSRPLRANIGLQLQERKMMLNVPNQIGQEDQKRDRSAHPQPAARQ